jgi:peptidoglycan/LPS O-acetylase OafA/YrhL
MKSEPRYIPCLDGLRAVAFLMVFVSHMKFVIFGRTVSMVGGTGVSIFFFLSGYLITTLLRIEETELGSISIRDFYIRRLFRIFPPMYLTIGIAFVAYGLGLLGGSLQFTSVVGLLFYFGNYVRHFWPDGLAVTWSLCVEEHFYLIFPLLYLTLARLELSFKSRAIVLSVLCGLGLCLRCFLAYGMHIPQTSIYVHTETRFDSILWGCVLALWCNPLFDKVPLWIERRLGTLALIGAGGVLVTDHIPFVKDAISFTLVAVSMFPIYWLMLGHPTYKSVHWLESAPLRFTGKLSYTLYLCHEIVISIISRKTGLGTILSACIALPICYLYAWLMYRGAEKPLRRLRNRLLSGFARKGSEQVVNSSRSLVPLGTR